MIKKGDTLIEVTIAIGIFSLIAITIAAVMSSGTSGSQTALETTLAREEIDAQAEALRFIHESYITSKDANQGNPYYKLWNDIKGQAKDSNSTDFNPSSCKELYDKTLYNQKAFILNTKALSSDDALITYNSNQFQPTATYPHVDYNGSNLSKAYGIYIVAVPDDGTDIVGQSNTGVTGSVRAFYDFYIRTCWYGLDAERPSNISTVIRLYDPPKTQATSPDLGDNYIIIYRDGKDEEGTTYKAKLSLPQAHLKGGETFTLPNPGTRFKYWAYDAEGSDPVTTTCGDNRQCVTPSSDDNFKLNSTTSLYAQWDDDESFTITYNLTGGSFNNPIIPTIECKPFEECDTAYRLIATTPTRPGYKFTGWRCTEGCQDSTKLYQPGEYFGMLPGSVTFTANWIEWYSIVYYDIDGRELSSCSAGSETNPGYYTIKCDETLKNPGEGQKFYGWSPDDSTIYQKGDTINSSTTGDRTVRLKPYWRVNITFSSEGWTPSSSGTIESCYIFNYAKPTNGSYYSVKKGAKYGTYNTAPADGYVVKSGGSHIEVLDSGIINLQGYCYRAADESVSYTIGRDDTFELSAQMNTAGIRTHPDGYASISIGPITATINSNNITSQCQSSSGSSYSFTNGNAINLKIEKHSNDYSVTVNGNVLKSCTVETNSDVQVKYAMVHNSHYCSELFNVQLTGINMQRYIKK